MDGVMRFYVNDSSTATDDAEADLTSSSSSSPTAAGLLGLRASVGDAAADADAGSSPVSTDSNANVVDTAVTDVAPCLQTVEQNSNADETLTPDVVEKQANVTTSSSEVLAEHRSGGERRDHVETATKTPPTSTVVERCSANVEGKTVGLSDAIECRYVVMSCSGSTVQLTAATNSSESGKYSSSHPILLPAASFDEAISRLSSSSESSPVSVDHRQSAIPVVDVMPVGIAESDSTSANVNMHTSTSSPSTASLLQSQDCSPAAATYHCDAEDTSTSSACPVVVPVVSLSCSSLVDRLGSYIPSPGPLAQMYGGTAATDAVQATSSGSTSAVSQTSNFLSTSSSAVRNSPLALYSPLKVGGDVSEITAKISAARSCTRNGLSLLRPSTVADENHLCQRRRADSLRLSLIHI